ncbi:cysteine hydrolase [Microbulbifer sp. A4B17]|uniref:cysteine hydrolase family protein n=1 Tax=Microbulbifer sp. A4B17 TaxID=359370 RepID=UPI000D52E052|nr:cysteine hydrolase family protein [Microbulbifer sp. A4B17]AWF80262.1 cysteine hydrolase [Microbulbifer sp. A4B17]
MSKTALIVVDMQNDYFEGGKWTLEGIGQASNQAAKVLAEFRKKQWSVIHVHYEFLSEDAPFFIAGSEGAKIHESLLPVEGEPVVLKNEVNSFKGTDLKERLEELGVSQLIIVGAMSHMCIDAITRAASDFGYKNTVIHDACASRDMSFNGVDVPAAHIHAAYMAALQFAYAEVINADTFLTQ